MPKGYIDIDVVCPEMLDKIKKQFNEGLNRNISPMLKSDGTYPIKVDFNSYLTYSWNDGDMSSLKLEFTMERPDD